MTPEEADGEPGDEDEEGDDEDEDETPRVILAKLASIAKWMPEGFARGYGDRPIWFMLQMDAELVSLFERIPEDPMPKGRQAAILGGLRAFAADRAEDLQRALGVTDAIEYGFHIDAPFARVQASFEEDGFLVAGTILEGDVKIAD